LGFLDIVDRQDLNLHADFDALVFGAGNVQADQGPIAMRILGHALADAGGTPSADPCHGQILRCA
jgi:hypothetical protein